MDGRCLSKLIFEIKSVNLLINCKLRFDSSNLHADSCFRGGVGVLLRWFLQYVHLSTSYICKCSHYTDYNGLVPTNVRFRRLFWAVNWFFFLLFFSLPKENRCYSPLQLSCTVHTCKYTCHETHSTATDTLHVP